MPRISFKSYIASLDAEKLSKLKYVEDGRYHYVYRITNVVEGKHYYGSRTSSVSPELDLGIEYFTSASANSWIIEDQKQKPQNYKYKIIRTGFKTRTDATIYESYLHSIFDVKNHQSFYNGSNQTPYGFDTTGNMELAKKITCKKQCKNENGVSIYTLAGMKIKETKSTIEWKDTVGVQSIKKQRETKNSREWKSTIGISSRIKEKETKTSYEYKVKIRNSLINTYSSDDWQKTTGVMKRKNISTTRIERGLAKGINNPNAKCILIYDMNNILMFECNGNFSEICKIHNLPKSNFEMSYRNSGKRIIPRKIKYSKFFNWYATIKE